MSPNVVGFVGPSGVGKTSLLERLVPVLAARGLVVGAVKHASHGFVADREGTDSDRLYRAGASAVGLVSGAQLATFVRRDGDVSLAAALAALPAGLDVVLVEGFSWEPIPRVVLMQDSRPPAMQHLRGGEVLSLIRLPRNAGGGPPVLAESLIASLADGIAERARRSGATTTSTPPAVETTEEA